jgi:hypothetical protein
MSSFNLADLIMGDKGKDKVKPIIKKKSKKGFTHGINVIFTNGVYKGYHGTVVDFYPASVILMMDSKAYIESEKYGPIVSSGSHLMTDVGDSVVEQVILGVSGKYVPIRLFKKQNEFQVRVGVVISDENIIMRSLMRVGKSIDEISRIMEDTNNMFISEIVLSSSLSMSDLNINDDVDVLVEKLTSMQIKNEKPSILDDLSEEIKVNESILNMIKKIENKDDVDVRVIFKKDIIGPQYYINVSDNLGDIKMYNPNKDQYLVSYKRMLPLNPNMVSIEKEGDKEFGVIKYGPYTGQRLEVAINKEAGLAIILSSNGKRITSHVVRKGDIVDELNNPVFEERMIYPSDVFYIDILLNNDNYAQVNKIIDDNIMNITEMDENRKYKTRDISFAEIKELQPGFKIGGSKLKVDIPDTLDIALDDIEEVNSDIEDESNESKEIDYAMSPVEGEEGEGEQKLSFKDIERTEVVRKELTREEQSMKDEILNILRLLKVGEDNIDVYKMIDMINSLLKLIKSKLKEINYKTDIMVTGNIKFILVCVVLYELIRVTGFDKSLDDVLKMLFPSYFTIRDIQANRMNDNIFLMEWSSYTSKEKINESIKIIKKYMKEKDYIKIIKELILSADSVLQGLLGLRINIIKRDIVSMEDLIPLGVNPVTGKKYSEERAEQILEKSREGFMKFRDQIVTVDDLINDKPLPIKEVDIIWSSINAHIIRKFENEIKRKADSQIELRDDYLYIRDNLLRAPFALRDDDIRPSVKKAFTLIYKKLLDAIVKQNKKIETGKKRKREEDEQVKLNRELFYTKDFNDEEEDNFEPKHTGSYLKEQGRREMQKQLTKSMRATNINAAIMKKKSKENKSE